jgi:predicted DNA-binding transcriptional regulator AlpA
MSAHTPLILDPLLSKDEVKRLITIKSDSTLYSLIRKGEFPAPITLTDSGARVAWPQSRVAAWIQTRKDLAAQLGAAGRASGPKPRQLVAQLKRQHPDWSDEQCVTQAKLIVTSKKATT